MSESTEINSMGSGVRIVGGLVVFMWILETIDWFTGHSLDSLGIQPRDVDGLWHIITAPFLHGGFGHLSANTVPFAVLGMLIFMRSARDFIGATAIITVLGGLGVWLVGRGSTHLGASELIFGYLGFLLLAGFFERSMQGIVVAITVGVVYGGALWGVFPGDPRISWEAHLFGFIAGVIAARAMTRS